MPKLLPQIELQAVTTADLKGMKVTLGPVRAHVGYQIAYTEDGVLAVDEGGQRLPYKTAVITSPLPAQLQSDIVAWLNSTVIPEINTREGL